MLNADQRSLVFAIIEENLKDPVREQRDTDHRNEQRNVFGEQPAAAFGTSWPSHRPPTGRGRTRQRPALRRVGMEGNGHTANLARTPRLVSCRSAGGYVGGASQVDDTEAATQL